MKYFAFLLFLFPACQQNSNEVAAKGATVQLEKGRTAAPNQTGHKNADLVIRLRSGLNEYSDVAIIKNLSTTNSYTATIRRTELFKEYKVRRNSKDTILIKRDTIVSYADVVIPPNKWRYLGVDFEGKSQIVVNNEQPEYMYWEEKMYKFKIIDSKPGGDVKQYLTNPMPFEKEQPKPSNLGAAFKGYFEHFYDTYQGDNKK